MLVSILYCPLIFSTWPLLVWIDCFSDLNLPYPKMIDLAVPANMVCGLQDLSANGA